MMPRTTKLTAEVQEKICDAIRSGLHQHRAAYGAGIAETTFYRWMSQGDPANAHNEPDLSAMSDKTLRGLARDNAVEIPKRASRATIIGLLNEAGAGTWEPYRAFRVAVEKAEFDLEQRLAAQIQTASAPRMATVDGKQVMVDPGKPNVLLTMLARRFKHWSPTHQVEVSGPDGAPVPIEIRAKAIAEAAAAFKRTQGGDE